MHIGMLFSCVYAIPHPRSLFFWSLRARGLVGLLQSSYRVRSPGAKPTLTPLDAILTNHLASVASKGLTGHLSCLSATLTKSGGKGLIPIPHLRSIVDQEVRAFPFCHHPTSRGVSPGMPRSFGPTSTPVR